MLESPCISSSGHGYWGPVTASIDWCEENYRWSYFVAEWWNTLSSMAIFAAGMFGFHIACLDGLETRFQVSHLLVASIGIGSACFHCTLRHVEQQCDETPMVLSQLNWFHELFADVWEHNSLASAVMPAFLAIYGLVFALLHNHYRWTTGFQAHFIAWAALNLCRCLYVSREKAMAPATFLLRRAWVATALGGLCWMADFHFCGELQNGALPNPEGHAWWHILIAYAIFQCTSFSIYRRYVQLGRPVKIYLKGPQGVWPIVRGNCGESYDKQGLNDRDSNGTDKNSYCSCRGKSRDFAKGVEAGSTDHENIGSSKGGSNGQVHQRPMPHIQNTRS